jgi:chemotaxis protein MotB
MARKKKHAEQENHERWLVSYADFITLLFAFFVVLFASSQTDKGKAEKVSESVKKALEGEKMSAMVAAILGGTVDNTGKGNGMTRGPGGVKTVTDQTQKDDKISALLPSMKILTQRLAKQISSGEIEVNMEKRGLVISFTQAALFPSGEDTIPQSSYAALEKVSEAIAGIPNPVRLEGHTDSRPIHNSRFLTNWDLSAARAIAVLEILSGRFDIPHERLSVAGYADTAPRASNDTEEGRAKNRHVDIVILNEEGVKAEPTKL